MSGLAEPVAVLFSGLEVTVYDVIGEPPVLAGAVKLTVACVFPAVAVTSVGASGTVAGVEEAVFDGVDVPTPFIARIWKSYDVPFVRPVTV